VRLRGRDEISTDSCSWYSEGVKLGRYRINGMKSPIKFTFFMAAPIEAANIYFRGYSLNDEILFGGISLDRLLSYQFKILHWPGSYASDWLTSWGFPEVGYLAMVASGYFDTVLLLILAIGFVGWLRSQGVRHPAQPDGPAEG